jgi:acetylglutamate kinase
MEKLYIIKVGGNIVDDPTQLSSFLQQVGEIFGTNNSNLNNSKCILVHGGGKMATKMATSMGVEQQMIDGRRITDIETLKIVTMVYAGYINKNIVAQLQQYKCNAFGLCGADGNAVKAHKRNSKDELGKENDYGFVGDVDAVNTTLLKNLLELGITPVIAPITHDGNGQLLNTNADTIAQEIATAISTFYETVLIYSFEKSGVLLDISDENSTIKEIKLTYYKELKEKQLIFAGMIPKLENAFVAINKGVSKVIIGNAEKLKSLINGDAGTTILNG